MRMTPSLCILLAGLFCSVGNTWAAAASSVDADLNQSYRALMAVLSATDQARLRKAQRAWLGFRDEECRFRTGPYADGSILPQALTSCIATLSQERTAEFRRQLDCQEGDISCVPHAQPAETARDDGGSCLKSAGAARAAAYAEQCLQVSPATHPPCNAENSCAPIIDEIKRGCGLLGTKAPGFCVSVN